MVGGWVGPGSVVCGEVSAARAEVFRDVDAVDGILVKFRGERVMLPRDVDEIVGAGGERYRMVRTPRRTSSGYGFMRTDALVDVTC